MDGHRFVGLQNILEAFREVFPGHGRPTDPVHVMGLEILAHGVFNGTLGDADGNEIAVLVDDLLADA